MKQIIEQHEEKLLNAFKECNVEVMEKLIHDDLIFNGPNGQVVTKEMDLAAYRSGAVTWEVADSLEREIQIFNDTAVVSTVVHLAGSFMDNPLDSKARFLRIWKEFNGEWKVIGGASIILA